MECWLARQSVYWQGCTADGDHTPCQGQAGAAHQSLGSLLDAALPRRPLRPRPSSLSVVARTQGTASLAVVLEAQLCEAPKPRAARAGVTGGDARGPGVLGTLVGYLGGPSGPDCLDVPGYPASAGGTGVVGTLVGYPGGPSGPDCLDVPGYPASAGGPGVVGTLVGYPGGPSGPDCLDVPGYPASAGGPGVVGTLVG